MTLIDLLFYLKNIVFYTYETDDKHSILYYHYISRAVFVSSRLDNYKPRYSILDFETNYYYCGLSSR